MLRGYVRRKELISGIVVAGPAFSREKEGRFGECLPRPKKEKKKQVRSRSRLNKLREALFVGKGLLMEVGGTTGQRGESR